MAVRLLCSSDFHLGRNPSRVPRSLGGGKDVLHLMLQRFRAVAEQNKVHAVVLAGDLVDSANSYFEGYALLAGFVRALTERGIAVLAVAGNHDYKVLGALSQEISDFHVLGKDGNWEECSLILDDQKISFVGWSFTSKSVSSSSVDSFGFSLADCMRVGIIHADIDSPISSYNPVALSQLQKSPVHIWVVGHVHKPQMLSNKPCVLITGSPQALDPGEQGLHGPWVVEIDHEKVVSCKQIPLADIRYETLEADVAPFVCADSLQHFIHRTVANWHAIHESELENTAAVIVRIKLVGTSSFFGQIKQEADAICKELVLENNDYSFKSSEGGPVYCIERLINEARLALDLHALAKYQDVVGKLARDILVLSEQPETDQARELMTRAQMKYAPLIESAGLTFRPNDETRSREQLIAAGYKVLSSILAQRPEV